MATVLGRVFDSASTPMLVVDDSSVCVEANEAACELARGTRGDLIGAKVEDLVARAGVRLAVSTTSDLAAGRHLVVLVPLSSDRDGDGVSASRFEREPLSDRERQVLALLAAGDNNGEVADTLGISSETVRNHTRNARRKLGARSRSHAIAIAITVGQLELTDEA